MRSATGVAERGQCRYAAAADLAEQSLRLTPSTDSANARRRLFLAAETHDVAGDTQRAIFLLEQERDGAPAGADRAAVLVRLADVQDDPRAVTPLYLQALDEAGEDDALTATICVKNDMWFRLLRFAFYALRFTFS